MALKFHCNRCGAMIVVRFLNIGEVAKCKACGAANYVPTSAITVDPSAAEDPSNAEAPRVPSDTLDVSNEASEASQIPYHLQEQSAISNPSAQAQASCPLPVESCPQTEPRCDAAPAVSNPSAQAQASCPLPVESYPQTEPRCDAAPQIQPPGLLKRLWLVVQTLVLWLVISTFTMIVIEALGASPKVSERAMMFIMIATLTMAIRLVYHRFIWEWTIIAVLLLLPTFFKTTTSTSEDYIKKHARQLLNSRLDKIDPKFKCVKIKLIKKKSKHEYEAQAILKNQDKLTITISVHSDYIRVEVTI